MKRKNGANTKLFIERIREYRLSHSFNKRLISSLSRGAKNLFLATTKKLASKVGRVCLTVTLLCGVSIWTDEMPVRTVKDLSSNLFGNAESIAIGSAAIVFLLEIPDRKKRDQYEAWQVINSGLGQTGSGGRIQALEDLCRDGVDLEGVAVPGSNLPKINLHNGKLSRANFVKAMLEGSNLSDSILSSANLSHANLRYANLSCSDLFGVNLSHADLEYAYMEQAKLGYADLRDANLNFAYMREVNLEQAYLFGGWLYRANLSCANLSHTVFFHANLNSAYLVGAVFCNTNLNSAKVNNARFGKGIGLSHEEKQDLIKRGAIFDDAP